MAFRLLRAWKFRTPSQLVPPSDTNWSHEYAVGSCLTSQWPLAIGLQRCFEEPCGAHAAADAHRDDAPALLLALQLAEERAHHARARRTVRVADRDRTAVQVELLLRDAELVATVDDLRRERLVQLPDVDVVDLEAGTLEELRHRVDWADA